MHVRVRGALLVASAVSFPGVAVGQPEDKPGGAAAERPEPALAPAPAEPAVARPPDDKPPPAAEPKFAWQPFGYLRLQYIAVQNDPNVTFVGRDDGFELQNARIGVRGSFTAGGAHAGFVVSIDGAVDERAQINTPDGKLRVGLRDAYGDVVLSGQIVARAGFFSAMVDPISLISDTSRELVDKPIESRGVRATEGYQTPGLTPGRSLGAAIRLDPEMSEAGGPKLGFELAIQNGADEYSSNNDNDKPAISGAALVRFGPADARHQRPASWLVLAIRYNPRTGGDLPFRRDEDDVQGSFGLQVAAGPVSFGGGGVFQRTSFPTTGGPVQNAFGGHAQLMIRADAGLPLAFGYRFGILDPSSLITTDRVMEHTAGVVLGVPRYRMRVQLQLTHVVEQRELSNSRAQLAAELAL